MGADGRDLKEGCFITVFTYLKDEAPKTEEVGETGEAARTAGSSLPQKYGLKGESIMNAGPHLLLQ